MWDLVMRAALKYLENHPDQIVKLLEQGVEAGILQLQQHNAKKRSQREAIPNS